MSTPIHLVLFDKADPSSAGLRERLAQQGFALECRPLADAAEDPSWHKPDVAMVVADQSENWASSERMAALLERLVESKVATIVWGASDKLRWAGGDSIEWLDPNVSLEEVVGRLSTLARYVPMVRQLERELNQMHRLGGQLNRYFSEIDQEMRLAGRLQRDFLPPQLPQLPGVQLAAVYRPASWVSGDMYDAFALDADHAGIFVADAMGHGVAAGLITMFLRRALVAKRTDGSADELVSPADALANLHDCLVRQKLPNCQFVTATYALYNTRKRELRLARGGHPNPLWVRRDGEIQSIVSAGSLLGLADVPVDLAEARLVLQPGEKVVFYTDGLEEDFFVGGEGHNWSTEFNPQLREWVKLDAREMVAALEEHLDRKEGSLHPADDVTLVALQVE